MNSYPGIISKRLLERFRRYSRISSDWRGVFRYRIDGGGKRVDKYSLGKPAHNILVPEHPFYKGKLLLTAIIIGGVNSAAAFTAQTVKVLRNRNNKQKTKELEIKTHLLMEQKNSIRFS